MQDEHSPLEGPAVRAMGQAMQQAADRLKGVARTLRALPRADQPRPGAALRARLRRLRAAR